MSPHHVNRAPENIGMCMCVYLLVTGQQCRQGWEETRNCEMEVLENRKTNI